MADPFVGQIKMFAGNFAPRGYALCDGQLLAISQNSALFLLLGTIYGGDGRTTFGLPGLRGRVPIHEGQGPGLSSRSQGQRSGTETETITVQKMPSHTHQLRGSADNADANQVTGNVLANATQASYIEDDPNRTMRSDSVTNVGGSQSHTNIMPFQCIHYIIALSGLFPSRN